MAKNKEDDVIVGQTQEALSEAETTPSVQVVQAIEVNVLDKYVVAKGKAITSKRGVISEGGKIQADYLGGGQESFDDLIVKGYIVKAENGTA